jgi:hypothetical protein
MREKLAKHTASLSLGSTAEVVRRAAKLAVVTILATTAVMVTTDRANAQEVDPSIADSDGLVPIYTVCFGTDSSEPYVPGAGYIPYQNGDIVEGIILFDECVAEELGLGPTDIQRTIEHELGHARGLLHSDDPTDIMYPVIPITGT